MKPIIDIFLGNIPVQRAYKGSRLFYQRDIPFGFTRVNFLKGDCNSWIDTGIKANQDTGIKIKCTREKLSDEYHSCIYGTEQPRFSLFLNVSKKPVVRVDYNNTMHQIITDISDIRLEYEVQLEYFHDKNAFYINGELQHTFEYASFQADSIFLWADNGYNVKATRSSSKIYWCKIYDNGGLVRDFIPCLDMNNSPCLYDKVSRETFYNKGTGNFTFG